ncbi:Bifunctional inhibitor/lipid-transfer protein/seed storage 2S albumin superfamily protein [Heracleum sosnowskyi]|uniref:Bifunctional inhibitor/lipid-transfer protein/seed storage 2S albumin superfamily protein n=1 Tax=Heracleum sosnowskyi TaxID=360622 RepID=A0AAD8M4F0_9APIA|nr:Bifunctional inhibitor/lipid-transfer protein/seed storage 2S albumin superfamily protein [Heracleum sosnowskyi]
MAISYQFKVFFMLCCTTLLFGYAIQVSGQCHGDIQGLMQQCARYVQKSSPESAPSKECCDVLKNVDLACVCQHITDQVEKIISMEKCVSVANSCGKTLAHGTRCGSYTVP